MPLEEKKKPINTPQPLVSIITPLYNAGSFISQTIESIQAQTYPYWEHIIVDDCSTDEGISIVQQYAAKDPRIIIVPQKTNQGAAVARNIATQMATGRFIAFLDADDLWHPSKLEVQVQQMIENKAAVSFTSYVQIDETGKELGKRIKAIPSLSYSKQLYNNYIGNLTGIYDTSTVGKIMAPNIRKRQDWAVWLEAISKSKSDAIGIQQDLAFYRVRTNSMSSNKWKLVKYNYAFYKEYLGFSHIKSIVCLLRFFWEYFVERPKQIEKY